MCILSYKLVLWKWPVLETWMLLFTCHFAEDWLCDPDKNHLTCQNLKDPIQKRRQMPAIVLASTLKGCAKALEHYQNANGCYLVMPTSVQST